MPSNPIAEAISYFNLEVARMESGDDSYSSTVRLLTLRSGERVVLKIPWIRRKLQREVSALRALRDDMPVPVLLDLWDPAADGSADPTASRDDRAGAMLLSHLPGAVITGPVSRRLAREMGALLARLHRHRRDHFGDENDTDERSAGWWELLHHSHDTWRPHCESALPPALWRAARERYEQLYADLPVPDGPCWVHSDYRPGNILVTGEGAGSRITGLIDFESARGGSADYDFVKISHYVWDAVPGTRDAFCEGYAALRPLPNIDRTLPFYRLHNAIGGIAWCVRRTSTADPFFQENLAVIEQSLGLSQGG
jgi:Ser/Thr protein kinase RdoA (MazF antagonist)